MAAETLCTGEQLARTLARVGDRKAEASLTERVLEHAQGLDRALVIGEIVHVDGVDAAGPGERESDRDDREPTRAELERGEAGRERLPLTGHMLAHMLDVAGTLLPLGQERVLALL